MADTSKKFRVSNTTRKPPHIDKKSGKDTRTLKEKVGYRLRFLAGSRFINLIPGTGPGTFAIVSDIDDQLLKFRERGEVQVEEVDVGSLLKEHTNSTPLQRPAQAAKLESGQRRARVVEMGTPAKAGVENEAVNPDGAPNFVVTAPSQRTRAESSASA